jgi:hypothetical protein
MWGCKPQLKLALLPLQDERMTKDGRLALALRATPTPAQGAARGRALMPQTLVIQTAAMMERRMIDQLRRPRVDVGLYFGEELMAEAWRAYDQKYQSTSDIANGPTRNRYGGERCVLGERSRTPAE